MIVGNELRQSKKKGVCMRHRVRCRDHNISCSPHTVIHSLTLPVFPGSFQCNLKLPTYVVSKYVHVHCNVSVSVNINSSICFFTVFFFILCRCSIKRILRRTKGKASAWWLTHQRCRESRKHRTK